MRFDFHYLLSGKYAQWICGTLILLFSLLIITEWLSLRVRPISVNPPPVAEDIRQQTASQDAAKTILQASLFGIYVANNLDEKSVKKSLLNVTLVGILFADKMEDSQVIIRASNGEEKTYKVGDTVPGDAVIKRITANGVLVERHGALESLSLPKNELIFEPVAKPLKEE